MNRAVTVDPRTDPAWHNLVAGRDSDVFQSPAWLRAVAETYGFDVNAAMLMQGAEPIAGLPYVHVDGLSGPRVAVFPFSDYCDPIAASAEEWEALIGGIFDQQLPITLRCLHSEVPLADERFTLTGRARWHGIDLEPLGDDGWDRLDSSARRAIRRSQRDEVQVGHAETRAELRAFYELHLRIRKHKYRLLAQPYAFFEHLWQEFVEAGNGTLLLARVGGELAAGVLFLEWKDSLYYKFNASDARFSDSRPNDALMWAGIEYGAKRGRRRIDLGLSDWDQEGLVRYKRKYASEEKTISFLSLTPDGAPPPASSRLAKLMPQLTQLLTDPRVPDDITERAGAALYRYFA